MSTSRLVLKALADAASQPQTRKRPAGVVDPVLRARELEAFEGLYQTIGLEILRGRISKRQNVTPLALHKIVSDGLPSTAISQLADFIFPLPSSTLGKVLSISDRTIQRKLGAPTQRLSAAQSGLALKFAEVVAKASVVLGSKEAAITWLTTPATGLEQQKPIDLLSTPQGTEIVEDFLNRMDYGVYS